MFNTVEEGKNTAIVSYITLIGALIAIFMNNEKKNSFAAFHIRQALGIFLLFFMLGYFIGFFDSWMITSSFWVFFFILWLYGFLGALSGKMWVIPVLGDFFQKIFKKVA
jgi:uncharacterized membrane protein